MFAMDNLERRKRLGAFNPTDEEFPDFRSMVLDNGQFKRAGRECNSFFGCFGHYVGAGLGWVVSLFIGSFLFCGAFVYSMYALGLVPFSLIYAF